MKTQFFPNFKPVRTFLSFRYLATLSCLLIVHLATAQDLEKIGKQKPFALSSGFSVTAGAYAVDGGSARQAPYNWAIAGQPVVSIYGVRFPFSIVYSNQHRSFQQPFNQFGVTPTWRWIKVHAGYSTARFSPYTLAGRRFLGAGVELTPGKLRFGFVAGRFQKAVAYDSTAQQIPGQYLSNVPVPAFSRHGYAVKLGVGSRKTFFDLSYLKAQDRTASLILPDGLMPLPQENAVLGFSTQITLFKRVTFKAEAAASAYTRDTKADSLDLTNIPGEKYIRKILLPRMTTQVLGAGETSIGYKDRLFGMRVGYKRVDPDFKSMGAYFFQTDIEQWTVAPSISMFKQKLQLSGSLGLQRNNLTAGKTNTTNRKISSANLNYAPNQQFYLAASYSNYGLTQKPRNSLAPVLTLDTLRLSQVSQAFMIAPNWNFGGKTIQHNIGLSANLNTTNDLNQQSSYQSDTKTWSGNIYYNLGIPARKLNLNAGLTLQKIENAFVQTSSYGINLGGQQSFGADKFSAGLNLGLYRNAGDNGSTGSTTQTGLNLNWKIAKWSNFFANATWLHTNGNADLSTGSFSEIFANGGLSFSF